MKTENLSVTEEEKKLIFNALRYYQMFKASYTGKEHKMCQDLLTHLSDEIYTQRKEQAT